MMRLLFGCDDQVAAWVAEQTGAVGFYDKTASWGILNEQGDLIGGVVFSNYTGNAIELSLAGGSSIQRGNMCSMFDYVFRQLKCTRLEVHIHANDKRLKKIMPRLGFEFEGRARCFYGEDDGLVFSLHTRNLAAFCKKWGISHEVIKPASCA